MKALIGHLNRFFTTITELYSLPNQLAADLAILSSYLSLYSPADEYLLAQFVEKQAEKLAKKGKDKGTQQKLEVFSIKLNEPNNQDQQSLTKKYSQLKLNLHGHQSINENNSCLERSQSGSASYRSCKNGRNEGIKTERHKLGTRKRNQTLKYSGEDDDKENILINHANLVVEMEKKTGRGLEHQKSLKNIKSQTGFLQLSNIQNLLQRQNSSGHRKDEGSRPKTKFDPFDTRTIKNSASLKIKLKSKPSLDSLKMRESLSGLCEQIQQHSEILAEWLKDQMIFVTQGHEDL